MSDDRVAELERRVELLTRLLETKQDRLPVPAPDEPVSRRAALRTAGALAAGAIAGGVGAVATASPAAATTATYTATGSSAGVTASTADPVFAATQISSSGSAPAINVYATNSGPAMIADGRDSSIQAYGRAHGIAIDTRLEGVGTIGLKISGASADAKAIVASSADTAITAFSGNVGGEFGGLRAALHFYAASGDPGLAPLMTYDVGDLQCSTDGSLWYCVEAGAGSPSIWRKIVSSETGGAFHPVTPFRAYDSRRSTYTVNGVIANSTSRTVRVADSHTTDTGSVIVGDRVPEGATAIAANVTVVGTSGTGYFCINPGGTTTLGASTINWYASGQTLANGVILRLNASREVTIVAGNAVGSAHLIIDITGYWR